MNIFMKTRQIIGFIISFIGLVLLVIGSVINGESFLIFVIYGLPLFIIGIVICFNRHEDKIEQVNYSRMKGGKNEKK